MATHRTLEARANDDPRVKRLTDKQYRMWVHATTGDQTLPIKCVGIFKMSTADFSKLPFTQEQIQDELGRSELEVALRLYNQEVPLSEEEKKLCQGNFPVSVIEYDPVEDMINNKLFFKFSAYRYLKTPKALCEGIFGDWKEFGQRSPERWWGEFMSANSKIIHEAWRKHQPTLRKKDEMDCKPIEECFIKLFDLEAKFSPSLIPSKEISAEEIRKLLTEKSPLSYQI